MSERNARRIFFLSIALIALGAFFLYGFAVGSYGKWPYGPMMSGKTIVKSLVRYGRIAPTNLYRSAAPDASRERIRIYDPEALQPGYYVLLGWDDPGGRYAAWLYDDQGVLRHAWPIDYDAMDPDGPSNGGDEPHGLAVMPDGSLILNFDHGDVLARIGLDGDPIWVKEGVFHHSLDRAEDGGLWTWRGEGSAYGHYQYLVKFDPENGETLREIDLVNDVVKGPDPAPIVFGLRRDHPFRHFGPMNANQDGIDIFHPNDIEELSSGLAPAFPQFAAGDLLLSFRNVNLVAVLDPESLRLKWWSNGPWVQQHDPDFRPDGRISVFNNNSGNGRSEITVIDPRTGELRNELRQGGVRFYSDSMGTHQNLPGGNVLITVPDEGRILQVSPTGTIVFEFNNVLPDHPGINAHVANAAWVPADHFDHMMEWEAYQH